MSGSPRRLFSCARRRHARHKLRGRCTEEQRSGAVSVLRVARKNRSLFRPVKPCLWSRGSDVSAGSDENLAHAFVFLQHQAEHTERPASTTYFYYLGIDMDRAGGVFVSVSPKIPSPNEETCLTWDMSSMSFWFAIDFFFISANSSFSERISWGKARRQTRTVRGLLAA